jgi:hypothetical protein
MRGIWGCWVAFAVLIGTTNATLAQSVNCDSGGAGALQTAINSLSSGQTLTITGTCTLGAGPGYFYSNVNPVTLAAGGGGATIKGQLIISVPNVTLNGLTIDGTGITPVSGKPNGGVVAGLGAAFIEAINCTIQNWSGNGVVGDAHAGVWINGGTVTNNAGAGLVVYGTASLADGPGGVIGNPVTISSNGTGIIVLTGGSVTMVNGSVENNTNDGVDLSDRSSIVFSTDGGAGTAITSNGGVGIEVDQGSSLTLGSGNVSNNGTGGIAVEEGSNATIGSNINGATPATATQITGNNNSGTGSAHAGVGVAINISTVTINGATITGNLSGAAVEALGSTAGIKAATISSVSGQPAVLGFAATLSLQSAMVTGPGNADTLAALAGSKVLLIASTIVNNDAIDATVLAVDGSTVESAGSNKICTGTLSGSTCTAASGGTAVTVTNGSTFHEVGGLLNPFGGADTITGNGSVQMESNLELGTGPSTPSSWTGNVLVEQNSSFRMDGGMTISGVVQILQGSNAFFNKSAGAGSKNIVAGGVTCPGVNAASHVAAPANVVTSSSAGAPSAVTIGTTPPACLSF